MLEVFVMNWDEFWKCPNRGAVIATNSTHRWVFRREATCSRFT